MKFIIKLLNLFALMGAVAWLCLAPDWEPGIAVVGFLVSFMEQERRQHFHLSKWDEKLMAEFLDDLPSNSDPIIYLRDHDMAGSFPTEQFFSPLANWTEKWKGEEYHFRNKNLEMKRNAFYKALDSFTWSVANNTWPHHNVSHMSSMEYDDCFNSPEKEKIRKELNESRQKAFDAYSVMVEEIIKHS